MYPHTYLSLFPPFPRNNQVFIAMSFDERFAHCWQSVIQPAVSAIAIDNESLSALRVDVSTIGDSVLTEILAGISNSRLFLADITTMGHSGSRAFRNNNVMYEVGIAHATRLPEEVILLRSDNDPLDFDFANIRVHTYDPDTDTASAYSKVQDLISNAIDGIRTHQLYVVRGVASSLAVPSWILLLEALANGTIHHKSLRSIGEAVVGMQRSEAIYQLLSVGLLRTRYLRLTPQTFEELKDTIDVPLWSYEITELGKAVVFYGARELGLGDPEMVELLERDMAQRSL